MADMTASPARAREIVQRLASSPRFAGSAAEADARKFCGTVLERAGFELSIEDFEFSRFPARVGPSVTASVLAVSLLGAHLTAAHGMPGVALAIVAAGVAIAALAGMLLVRRGVAGMRWMRTSATNVVARRKKSGPEPTVWLVAHLDSKSQTIPMLVRIAAIVAIGLILGALVLTLLLQVGGVAEKLGLCHDCLRIAGAAIAFAGAIATLPVILCFIGNESLGALDNASGVASVLLASELVRPHANIGVVLTSAEELGLAGAGAFARSRTAKGVALNCDTIDDEGRFICMRSDSSARSDDIAAKLQQAARREGVAVQIRRTIPGILTDGTAFSDAGWSACTLSRGNLRTLARVHTRRDGPALIRGTGIAQAACMLATTAEEFA